MPEQKNPDKFKLYFFYFLVASSAIILIFAFVIIGAFWSYWSKIWRIEDFYSQKSQTAVASPQINQADPILGNTSAKVVIIEYSDFFCPACANLNSDLNKIETLYGNKIAIVFKALPIINQLQSKNAALAAYCSAEQNKFWDYKNSLFENSSLLTDNSYATYAESLGLNQQLFSSCYSTQKYESVINDNTAEALKLNISSLPTFYINGQKIEGYITYDSLKAIIDNLLSQ